MSEHAQRAWVKTSLLDEVVLGKVNSSTRRIAVFEADDDDGEGMICNWGWAQAEVLNEGSGGDELSSDEPVKIYVRDEESEHNRATVEIPAKAVADGKLVMANDHKDYDDEPEDEPTGMYPDDMITLTHLHEPAVVYCLRKRYALDKIYTATGSILLVLNPFKNCKELYSDKMMQLYWKRGEAKMSGLDGGGGGGEEKKDAMADEDEPLPPHAYGIADDAYRTMMMALEAKAAEAMSGRRRPPAGGSDNSGAQSILVSGESGAGKTVTTKHIMGYLAKLSTNEQVKQSQRQIGKQEVKKGRVRFAPKGQEDDPVPPPSTGDGKKSVEQQVLGSNPILESFGNARTIRNDNSSRFGKFIEIQFTNSGNLSGASIETYLLEKVRLTQQAIGERNYHVFYEILAGMDDEQREKYSLYDFTPEDFCMTNTSGTYDRRDGVDDYDTYSDLMNAMDVMGFPEDEQNNILSITSACLHFSNIEVEAITADESKLYADGTHLEAVQALLGTTYEELNRSICYFSITAGKETHVRSIGQEKAARGVLGLFKNLYGALFTAIVKHVNSSITVGNQSRATRTASFIGVLDIFGFESFKVNSFEQLCINFCNEALQRQFNQFVLKNEQDEYEREGIKWSVISFPDNQEVLDLIDKKGVGILKILDDQCRAPGCTDKSFAQVVYQKCRGHKRFQADFRQVGAMKFAIVHYAGPVEYDIDGFVEKNKDELPKEATEMLQKCSNEYVKKLAVILSGGGEEKKEDAAPSPARGGSRAGRSGRGRFGSRPALRGAPGRGGGGAKKKTSVGGNFSTSLSTLLVKIETTSPHYVRCLKPNDKLIPDNFDPVIIADQLRCAGVVEAVRVSRLGYPQRYTHNTFLNRYKVLAIAELKKASRGGKKQRPVDTLVNAIATKIYELENPEAAAKSSKGKAASGSSVDLEEVGLQVGKTKVFLRRMAFDLIERLRKRKSNEAAVTIQKYARVYLAVHEYAIMKRGFIVMQSIARRNIAMEITKELRKKKKAVMIQTNYKRYVCRRKYLAMCVIVKWCQRMQRGILGRRRYKTLNELRKSIIIQKYWRRFILHKDYISKKNATLTIQCAYRCVVARRELKQLKVAAKDLANVAEDRNRLVEERKMLMAKMAKMESQRMEAEKKAKESVGNDAEELKKLRAEFDTIKKELEKAETMLKEEKKKFEEAEGDKEGFTKKIALMTIASKALEDKLDSLSNDVNAKEEEIINLKQECTDIRDELASKTSSLEEEIKTLEEENESLKNQEPPVPEETEGASLEEMEELEAENEQLRHQLDEMKQEKFFGANETVQQLEEALEEVQSLKTELKEAQENKGAPVMMAAAVGAAGAVALTTTDPGAQLELDKAKREVESLKLELEFVKAKAKDSVNRPNDFSSSTLNSSIPQDLSKMTSVMGSENEDMRYEVLRLEKELEDTKQQLEEAKKEKDMNNKSMSMNNRYEELARLAGACMDKDREIQELRNQVDELEKELDEARANARNGDDESFDSLSSIDEKDDQSFWGGIFQKKEEKYGSKKRRDKGVSRAASQELMTVEDASALRGVNEMLRRELESACTELNETKRKLSEEMERSAQDMEAFAEALRGVDELRTAAEMMSRELTRIKKKKRWASYRNISNELELDDDDDQSVVSMATTQLEDAKKTISQHSPSVRQILNPIWGKVDNNNQAPPMDVINEDVPKFAVFGRSKSKKTSSINAQHNFKSGHDDE